MIKFNTKVAADKFKEFLDKGCIAYCLDTANGFEFHVEMYHKELVESHVMCARTWDLEEFKDEGANI